MEDSSEQGYDWQKIRHVSISANAIMTPKECTGFEAAVAKIRISHRIRYVFPALTFPTVPSQRSSPRGRSVMEVMASTMFFLFSSVGTILSDNVKV